MCGVRIELITIEPVRSTGLYQRRRSDLYQVSEDVNSIEGFDPNVS